MAGNKEAERGVKYEIFDLEDLKQDEQIGGYIEEN